MSIFGRLRRRRREGERGAILVEMALILPLVVLLLTGVLEYGMGWRESLNLSGAVRASARQASSAGTSRAADYLALQGFMSTMGRAKGVTVDKVVVYYTDRDDGQPLNPACFTSVTPPPSARCNVYTAAKLSALGSTHLTHFGPDTSCVGSWDVNWCPLDRKDKGATLDSIGVWAQVTYEGKTSLIPGSMTMTDRAVMQIEPSVT